VVDFILDFEATGVQYVICTDISKDGMLEGTSNELYIEIMNKTEIKLIASGGVTSIQDVENLIEMGCEGAIIGKAIYEQKITMQQLRKLC
jgi:phosphoribosylformimino-5-aminoimidazole carboxamide ribotide isomerase